MSQTYRILALDPDVAFLAQLDAKLASAGFAVKTLRDPMRLVPEATAFAPTLILMDRVLPVLTGAECIRSLRAFPGTQHLPVAFVITNGSENEVIRSIRSGALDVIRKPLVPSHVPRITSLCQEMSRQAQGRALAVPPADALISLYRREKRNGTLQLNPGTPFEGRAVFVNGEFARAEFGPLGGRDALEEMLLEEDGTWRFQPPGVGGPVLAPVAPKTPPRSVGPEADVDHDAPTPVPITTAAQKPKALYRPRLLIVDDDASLRHLFRSQLSQGGFDVVTAEDGLKALEVATSGSFDCVVSDLNMPRLDGWALLEKLKGDQRTREVPVIILSAQDDYREMLRIARAGAHDYLAKTGHAGDVISRVMSLLSPRINFEVVLESGLPVGGILLKQLGAQWLLRSLARNEATGTLHLEEEWGEYHLAVNEGRPVAAKARSGKREVTGMSAVAALVVSRSAEGTFYPGPPPTGPGFGFTMEELLARTCKALNALDENVVEHKLKAGAGFEVDPALYELYRRLAPDASVRMARAICEQRHSLDEIARSLELPPRQIAHAAIELLHRGIIRFTADP